MTADSSKAYQPKTGIAGYTLIYNSYVWCFAAHEPFESVEKGGAGGKRKSRRIYDSGDSMSCVVKLVAATGHWKGAASFDP